MVTYTLQDLFDADSTMYDLNIELTDGTVYNNQNIMSEEFTMTESACSQETISFGQCESSSVKFKLLDISRSLKDQYITIKLILNGDTQNPFILGTYKVFDDTVSDDKEYREVTAYDELYYICQLNVIDWYNSLWTSTENISLKKFRDSFFEFIKSKQFNCNVETAQLPNDNLLLKKGVDGDSLTGGTVLKSICEINGCFGHIKRNGNFSYLLLKSDVVKEYDYTKYTECYPKDYYTDLISMVQIKYSDDSAYSEYGTGDNVYSITGNFLLFGLEESQLKTVAKNIYETISGITYCPVETFNLINADPCVEVGDYIKVTTTSGSFNTYVLSRTISGIQGMFDSFVAKGTKEIGNRTTTLSEQLKMINGRTRTLKNTVDELGVEFTEIKTITNNTVEKVTDLSTTVDGISATVSETTTNLRDNYSTTEQLKSMLKVTSDEITSEVSKTYTTKQETTEVTEQLTRVTQTADKINWLVKSGTSETDFTLTDRTVELVTDSFTITDSTGTQTIIEGGKLQAQSIGAEEIRADELTVGKLYTSSNGRNVSIDSGVIKIGQNVRIDAGLLNAGDEQNEYVNALNFSCLGQNPGQCGLRWWPPTTPSGLDYGYEVNLVSNYWYLPGETSGGGGVDPFSQSKWVPSFSLGEEHYPIRLVRATGAVFYGKYSSTPNGLDGVIGVQISGDTMWRKSEGGLIMTDLLNVKTKMFSDTILYNTLTKDSDERLKKDISPITQDVVKNLIEDFDPVSFKYKSDKDENIHFGTTAQKVVKTMQNIGIDVKTHSLVSYEENESGNKTYSLAYDEYIPLIIAYCQYLKKCVDNLQK